MSRNWLISELAVECDAPVQTVWLIVQRLLLGRPPLENKYLLPHDLAEEVRAELRRRGHSPPGAEEMATFTEERSWEQARAALVGFADLLAGNKAGLAMAVHIRFAVELADEAMEAHAGPADPRQDLTIVNHSLHALYAGDGLVWDGQHWFPPGPLEALGHRVEVLNVRWEDMPDRGQNEGHAPASLAYLREHFARLAAQRRRQEIADLRERLAELEAEEEGE